MDAMYQILENRPYACLFCGSVNNGRVADVLNDPTSDEIITECVWSCSKCGRVYKRGIISIRKK